MNKALTNPAFDYSIVEADVKERLIYYEAEVARSRKRVAEEVIKHGEIFRQVQQELADYSGGVFLAWLESVGVSKSSAYRAMDAYTAFNGIPSGENIEVSAMYALAKNEKARKRAIRLLNRGVKVTQAMATQLIQEEVAKEAEEPDDFEGSRRRRSPPRKLDAAALFKEWDRTIGPLVRLVDRIARDVGEPRSSWKKAVHKHLENATDDIERGLKIKT